MAERRIGPDDLQRVKTAIRLGSETDLDRARHWWESVLAELTDEQGAPPLEPPFHNSFRAALDSRGLASLADQLLSTEEDEDELRSDRRDDGALAVLSHHIDLRSLHNRLAILDGDGLRLDRPQRLLEAWLRANGHHLATALSLGGRLQIDDAKKAAHITVPDQVVWTFNPELTAVLDGAVQRLKERDLTANANRLADSPLEELAELCGLTVEAFLAQEGLLWSPDERRRLNQEAMTSWRRSLKPILVSALADSGALPHQIRALAQRVDEAMAGAKTMAELQESLAALLGDRRVPRISSPCYRTGNSRSTRTPRFSSNSNSTSPPRSSTESSGPSPGTPENKVDDLRRRSARIVAIDLKPLVPVELRQSAERDRDRGNSRYVRKIKVRKDQKAMDLAGADAERWVLSTVMEPLVLADASTRTARLKELVAALGKRYPERGPAVEEVVRHAEAAMTPADDENLHDKLAAFMHLSDTSDDFGCDVLGYLDPSGGDAPRPLFLEVKSVGAGWVFYFSTREYDVAKALKSAYAIAAVVRPKEGDEPTRIDLLVNPVALKRFKTITMETDTWRGSYETGT